MLAKINLGEIKNYKISSYPRSLFEYNPALHKVDKQTIAVAIKLFVISKPDTTIIQTERKRPLRYRWRFTSPLLEKDKEVHLKQYCR